MEQVNERTELLTVKGGLENSTWLRITSCPACGVEDTERVGKLELKEYQFGNERLPLPPEGVEFHRCRCCGLVFKDTVPSPAFLAEVFARHAGKVWAGDYEFSEEAALVRQLVDGEEFDLLDIGPSNGGLLRAFSETSGRRSALDIIRHPGLEEWLRGEFISGLAESEELSWSGEPYDVVSVFDVAEHFYNPHKAFSNLRTLVKLGGFVIVETGDVHSREPQKFGMHKWWYACLFPHHVFWSRASIEHTASQHGFETIAMRRKRHKEQTGKTLSSTALQVVKRAVYQLVPRSYERLQWSLGKPGVPPRDVIAQDHMQLVLRARS